MIMQLPSFVVWNDPEMIAPAGAGVKRFSRALRGSARDPPRGRRPQQQQAPRGPVYRIDRAACHARRGLQKP